MKDTEKLIADMKAALKGATPGPWQVIEHRWPWKIDERELLGKTMPAKSGEHVDRQIATVAIHPQLKAPWQVVCMSVGVGVADWKKPVHFVHIEPGDAAFIALCSPDNISALLSRIAPAAVERTAEAVAWANADDIEQLEACRIEATFPLELSTGKRANFDVPLYASPIPTASQDVATFPRGISQETKDALAGIDANIRNAAINMKDVLVGASPVSPPPDVEGVKHADLVERLNDDAEQLERASCVVKAISGVSATVGVKDISSLLTDLREAATTITQLAARLAEIQAKCCGCLSPAERDEAMNELTARLEEAEKERGRLFNDQEPMACEMGKMTAAEDVLAWLLIEKLGCVDDRTYTPHEAQKIIANFIDQAKAAEASLARAREALQNAKGLLDTPIGRRRHADDPFYVEVIESIRAELPAPEQPQ